MLKKILRDLIAVLACILLVVAGFFLLARIQPETPAAKIITSNFIGYDLARAVTGDDAAVRMLINPGSELHHFEPTPQDIIDLKNADLFIYNGGESEAWVEKVLADNDIPEENTLRLMDFVELKAEGEALEADDEEDSDEPDEHIWTSLANTQQLLAAVSEKIRAEFPENAKQYQENTADYAAKISQLDQDFRSLIASSNRKPLIFGDRFPFRYFVDEYGLDYYAAFPGCSDQAEASSSTVAALIEQAQSEDASTILKIELTSPALAQTIADATGAMVRELHSAHNISKSDFDAGVTYVDLLKNNLETLKAALN